jgi:hypothetical protein
MIGSPTLILRFYVPFKNFSLVVRLCFIYSNILFIVYLITELPFGTPLFVSHCDISLIPRTPDISLEFHFR